MKPASIPATTLPVALSDFTWRPLRYTLPAFLAIALAAMALAGQTTWPEHFIALFVAYSAGYAVMLAAKRTMRAVSLRVASGLVALSVIAAAATTLLLKSFDTQGAFGPGPNVLFEVGVAALLTGIVIGLQVQFDLRLNRQRRIADESKRRTELEREVLQAELKVLQAQIEPHFLYNTLATVRVLVADRPDDARRVISDLIHYLRQALPSMRGGLSTVERELELCRAYLAIMEVRMGGRLKVSVSVDPEITQVAMPPTIAGTLVENAIKHGIEPSPDGGTVTVTARRNGRGVQIEVADTGVGFRPSNTGSGVGLDNARERLRLLYGDRAELELLPNSPRGVIARVSIAE